MQPLQCGLDHAATRVAAAITSNVPDVTLASNGKSAKPMTGGESITTMSNFSLAADKSDNIFGPAKSSAGFGGKAGRTP